LENRESVDQKRCQVQRFLEEHTTALSQQGSVQSSWRYHKGQRSGPFYRLSYRQGGRQCNLYLGRDHRLAAEVRLLLEKMQAPLRRRRQVDRQVQQIKAELKTQKHLLDQDLEQKGLYRKGHEIRGWRRFRKSSRDCSPAQRNSAT
jgi:hypothetical protein